MKKIAFTIFLIATKLTAQQLPILTNPGDTLVFNKEVWVQDPKSEIKQRLKISKLEKRIDKVLKLLRKKEGYEFAFDSLMVQVDIITKQKDSILNVIDSDITKEESRVRLDVQILENDLISVKNKYLEIRRSRNIWRKSFIFSAGGNIILLMIFL